MGYCIQNTVGNKNVRGCIADMMGPVETNGKFLVHKLGKIKEKILLHNDFPVVLLFFLNLCVKYTTMHTPSSDKL